jgi:alpha-tubulin suppressor-like RCC1 family protein
MTMTLKRTPLILCAVILALASTMPAAARVEPGRAEHWGAFFGDNIGADSNLTLRPFPLRFEAPVREVGTSNSTQYALLDDGTLWAWGQGTNGQLGNGARQNSFSAPVRVRFPAGVKIASIPPDAMPYDTGLAVDTHGNAWGWGFNKKGELCLGDARSSDAPRELPLRAPVTSLAGADNHAVYDADGTVYSCGSNYGGVLGDGHMNGPGSHSPVRVDRLRGTEVTTLVSAYDNAGALLADGTYYDWGYDAAGQLGNSTVNQPSDLPVQVPLPGPVTQVAQGGSAAGNGQTLVMLANGSLYAWGNDTSSQLGDGGTANEPSPVRFAAPAGVVYATLASGGATSYAISAFGAVYAWGDGTRGQIGNGDRQTVRKPALVETGAATISSTAADVVVVR